MKLIKVDSCTNCPLCSYYPTDYYRNAYFRCTKSGFDVTGNYYSGTIYERCQLENEPNSSNTVLCGEGHNEAVIVHGDNTITNKQNEANTLTAPNGLLATGAQDTVAEAEETIYEAAQRRVKEKSITITAEELKKECGISDEEQP